MSEIKELENKIKEIKEQRNQKYYELVGGVSCHYFESNKDWVLYYPESHEDIKKVLSITPTVNQKDFDILNKRSADGDTLYQISTSGSFRELKFKVSFETEELEFGMWIDFHRLSPEFVNKFFIRGSRSMGDTERHYVSTDYEYLNTKIPVYIPKADYFAYYGGHYTIKSADAIDEIIKALKDV